MKTIINNNGGTAYSGDILFRIYPNQELIGKVNDFCDEWYCFEVLTKGVFTSEYKGQYTSNHPQAAQNIMEKLLNEQKNMDVNIEFSNELINGLPHSDCRDKDWFDTAIRDAIKGWRKYN